MAKRVRSVKALTQPPESAPAARERRLAEALRQNLRRRKAQARDAASSTAPDDPAADEIERRD